MEKECFRCHKVKPVDEFYPHRGMADGRLGKCKECTKGDVTVNRNANILEIRIYDRERAKTPGSIANRVHSTRRWRQKNPRKWAAQMILNNAIRVGKLTRELCGRCGSKAHAHHENYDHPLEVTWLCAVHHSGRHREMKRLGIVP